MNVVNFYQKFPNTYIIQAGVNVMLKYEAIILCHILREDFVCMEILSYSHKTLNGKSSGTLIPNNQ